VPVDLVYPYRVQQSGKASHWHIGGLWRTPTYQKVIAAHPETPPRGGSTG
jgi:hypothetical protein